MAHFLTAINKAQRATVEAYARQIDGNLMSSFTEIESGRRPDRPELAKALSIAKAVNGTVCVAKLDRLDRNVAFLATLIRAGVDFVACDNPHATKLTLHILAAVAEDEAERISTRVREALAAYKARGGVLGARDPRCRYNLTNAHRLKGSQVARSINRRLAAEFRAALRPVAQVLRHEGRTLRETAAALNAAGYTTRRGGSWTLANVWTLLTPADWEQEA